VHAKGTLWTKPVQPTDLDDEGRVRDRLQQAKLLHGLQWLHPGKKLLFMGAELGHEREWNQDRELDWRVHTGPARQALQAWIAALNGLYRTHPALHGGECGGGKGGPPGEIEGFEWIDGSDDRRAIIVFARRWQGQEIVVLLHGTPVGFPGHWVMVPRAGQWTCILRSDLTAFGGEQKSLPVAAQSFEEGGKHWVKADVPPYGVIVWAGVASRKRRA
jgi:1,4-alpha-glucan branching enzyme